MNLSSKPSPEELGKLLTVYGRKPVLEALLDPALDCRQLHMAQTNRHGGIVDQIIKAAEQRGCKTREHSRESLARISKNGKQDQGVALDIRCPEFNTVANILPRLTDRHCRLLALDGITNPQNVGMIIRSAVAGGIDGIIYPHKGVAALGPLVIKASVGTVFKAPLLFCDTLVSGLQHCITAGGKVAVLTGNARQSLFEYQAEAATVYVLGGETEGVSKPVMAMATAQLRIPMAGGVESLNVAVAASLISYAQALR